MRLLVIVITIVIVIAMIQAMVIAIVIVTATIIGFILAPKGQDPCLHPTRNTNGNGKLSNNNGK